MKRPTTIPSFSLPQSHDHHSPDSSCARKQERSITGILLPAMLIILFTGMAAPAYALTPLEAETMEARVLIMNTVNLEPTGGEYYVRETTGTLTWYPRENWLQEVQTISVDPLAAQSGESYVFRWENPLRAQNIRVTSTVKTRNAIVPVRERIPFPLQEIPPDVEQYLAPGEITDTNPEIRALAQELAAGKTDAYEVIYTLADWTTTNVNYSLASVGQPASQRSSQVLKSRYGKCDELTSLFISMNRALGIPARFVAGYAYTNSELFDTEWGGHGWAEVWLPGQGWVPYDVTYGEYGYLSAGHVALKTAPDAKETSIDYRAQGIDFRLQTEPLDITVTPTQMTARTSDVISLSLEAPNTNVGFGSAVLILANVKNNRDYYVSTRLDLGKTSNANAISDNYRNVLLKPRESKVVPFLVRIDENLQSGYRYEFPFRLRTRLGPEASIIINARQDFPVFDKSSYDETIERYAQKAPAQSRLIVACDQGPVRYVGEETQHNCIVRGIKAQSIEVCPQKAPRNCTKIPVQDGAFTLSTHDQTAGIHTSTYNAKMLSETAQFYVTGRSIAPTELKPNITHPEFATPDETVTAVLALTHAGALPKNVTVDLQVQRARSTQNLEDLAVPAQMSFTIPGRVLRPGENTIVTTISSTDELGKRSTKTVESKIMLTDVGAFDRMRFWLEDAGYWIEDLFA